MSTANTVVFSSEGRKKYVTSDQLADYDYSGMQIGQAPKLKGFKGEEQFTSAILGVVNPKVPKIYFSTGHGEHDPDGMDADGYSQLQGRDQARQLRRGEDDAALGRRPGGLRPARDRRTEGAVHRPREGRAQGLPRQGRPRPRPARPGARRPRPALGSGGTAQGVRRAGRQRHRHRPGAQAAVLRPLGGVRQRFPLPPGGGRDAGARGAAAGGAVGDHGERAGGVVHHPAHHLRQGLGRDRPRGHRGPASRWPRTPRTSPGRCRSASPHSRRRTRKPAGAWWCSATRRSPPTSTSPTPATRTSRSTRSTGSRTRCRRSGIAPRSPEQVQLFLSETQMSRVLLISLIGLPACAIVLGVAVWWRRRR